MQARFNKPLAVVAVGACAWILASLAYGASVGEASTIGLLLIGIGLAAAAFLLDRARLPAAGAFALAAVGMVLFLGSGLGSLDNTSRVASHLFLAALLVLAGALAFRSAPRALLLRIGGAVACLGALLWLVADLNSVAWQPGNILAAVGSGWLASDPPDVAE